jgi:hypothetical protein
VSRSIPPRSNAWPRSGDAPAGSSLRPAPRSRTPVFASLALFTLTLALLLAGRSTAYAAADTIVGHAIVQDDGTLLIKNRSVKLFGIFLAPTDRQCRGWLRPVRCADRGVLALDFKVRGFVTCLPRGRDDEGRIHATCYLGRTGLDPGEDLAAYLIQQGWALALPNAPFEYQAMERIAQSRERGVWGNPVDSSSGALRRRDWR